MRGATLAVLLVATVGAVSAEASQPADPEPAAAAELIDPDCYPDWARQADPSLLEEPDGICPPRSPEPPEEGPEAPVAGAKPELGPGGGPEPAPPESPATPTAPQGFPDPAAEGWPGRQPSTEEGSPGSRRTDAERRHAAGY